MIIKVNIFGNILKDVEMCYQSDRGGELSMSEVNGTAMSFHVLLM